LACLAVLIVVGCRPAERIESYTVPKEPREPVAQVDTATSTEPTDRMLAAILPEGDQAWFLKIVGPLAEVDDRAERLTKFFASVRPAGGKPHPDWQLPAGWQEQPGTGMRAATITIPTDGKPLDLSVTSLPWSGTRDELLSNVNRWRGQMQLAPTDSQGLDECTRELTAGDATMTIVDLRGRMQSGGMTPPFAGVGLGGASGPTSRATDLPAGHPPIAPTGASAPAPFQFVTPTGWQARGASGMRKAEFGVADGAKEAVVTVIDFRADAGPMMADPAAQVERWRTEIGLAPLGDADAKRALQPIEIDGAEAQYVEVLPDAAKQAESEVDRGTLAAMLRRGEVIWFFKITGDRELVAAQRDQFKSFVKSVRFTGSGANDGH
jgi:hypothetical protein